MNQTVFFIIIFVLIFVAVLAYYPLSDLLAKKMDVFIKDAQSCQVDSDCAAFDPECCHACTCGPSKAVNKDYHDKLKFMRKEKCRGFDVEQECPAPVCSPVANEPYCNENKRCSVRIDCPETCKLMEEAKIDSFSALWMSKCDCPDLKEEIDFCRTAEDCKSEFYRCECRHKCINRKAQRQFDCDLWCKGSPEEETAQCDCQDQHCVVAGYNKK